MKYEQQAEILYANSKKLSKATASGRLIDNRLKLEYTSGGITNCHFDMENFLKYFVDLPLPNKLR